jgi:glyoxylase-like metal-dependent hydrolase (beta-lactamase superfamily II)
MLHANAADGIHRIEDAYTNWYLVEHDDRMTVVDSGVPTSWRSFRDALRRLGRSADDVAAVVLTHGHFDHLGFAEKARHELGVPVYVHDNDVPLTRHPWRYDHERPRSAYVATQLRALPMVVSLVRNRAWLAPPVKEVVRSSTGRCPCRVRRASSSARATRSATVRCTSPIATSSSPATPS